MLELLQFFVWIVEVAESALSWLIAEVTKVVLCLAVAAAVWLFWGWIRK